MRRLSTRYLLDCFDLPSYLPYDRFAMSIVHGRQQRPVRTCGILTPWMVMMKLTDSPHVPSLPHSNSARGLIHPPIYLAMYVCCNPAMHSMSQECGATARSGDALPSTARNAIRACSDSVNVLAFLPTMAPWFISPVPPYLFPIHLRNPNHALHYVGSPLQTPTGPRTQ